MKEITRDVFFNELNGLLDGLLEKEEKNIVAGAQIMAEAIAKGGVIHVLGSGHSVGFAMEMQNRVGSLACVHKIETNDFVLKGKVTLDEFKNSETPFERRAGVGNQLYELYDIRPEDCFIIISNSGINGVVIDLAVAAKEHGHKVIVVTSWQHTSAEASRHPSGFKLYEKGDVVIDNCGPRGDALIETGKLEKICSVSSITGAFIAQSLECESCRMLKEQGAELPIFWDEAQEGGAAHNAALRAKYAGRV